MLYPLQLYIHVCSPCSTVFIVFISSFGNVNVFPCDNNAYYELIMSYELSIICSWARLCIPDSLEATKIPDLQAHRVSLSVPRCEQKSDFFEYQTNEM